MSKVKTSNLIRELSERATALRTEVRDVDSSTTEGREKIAAISKELGDISERIAAESKRLSALFDEAEAESALSESEARDLSGFDFAKILRHMDCSMRGQPTRLDGVEAECVTQGATQARSAGLSSGGLFLPFSLVRRSRGGARAREARAALSAGVPTQGGLTIATEKLGLLDDFFDKAVMHQAGATILEGLSSNIDLPRLVAPTAKPTGKDENQKADEADPSFAALSLSPKRLAAYIDISEQLLNQSSTVVEQVLRSYLTTQLLTAAERAFFHGTGTKEATGLLNTTGISSVAGNAPVSLKMLVDLESAVDSANALQGSLHYVSNGAVRGALKQTPIIGSTDSRRLLEANADALNGYAPLFTNAIRRDLGGTGDRSALFFGNFAEYVCAYWDGVSLELVRDKHNAQHGLYTLVASLYYDGGVRRPASFAACADVKLTA